MNFNLIKGELGFAPKVRALNFSKKLANIFRSGGAPSEFVILKFWIRGGKLRVQYSAGVGSVLEINKSSNTSMQTQPGPD